jgi:hypothetical protein
VAENRKIVIIIDGAAPIQEFAENIAAIIGGFQGCSAAVIQAESFSGSDLLPAYAFFLGCEEPNPLSFSYIEELFQHINLAGRSCGVFSSSGKALEYLSLLVSDSEATVGKPFLTGDGAADGGTLSDWIQGIIK